MNDQEYDRLQLLSGELTGNGVLLPVAAAVAALAGQGTVSAPQVMKHLGGRAPANRISDALRRLHRLGGVRELPYPGRPHPRLYEVVSGPFWDFIKNWALDETVELVDS